MVGYTSLSTSTKQELHSIASILWWQIADLFPVWVWQGVISAHAWVCLLVFALWPLRGISTRDKHFCRVSGLPFLTTATTTTTTTTNGNNWKLWSWDLLYMMGKIYGNKIRSKKILPLYLPKRETPSELRREGMTPLVWSGLMGLCRGHSQFIRLDYFRSWQIWTQPQCEIMIY